MLVKTGLWLLTPSTDTATTADELIGGIPLSVATIVTLNLTGGGDGREGGGGEEERREGGEGEDEGRGGE